MSQPGFHLSLGDVPLGHPGGDGRADQLRDEALIQPCGLPDRAPAARQPRLAATDDPRAREVDQPRAKRGDDGQDRAPLLGGVASLRQQVDAAAVVVDLEDGQLARRFRAGGGAEQDEDEAYELGVAGLGHDEEAGELVDREEAPARLLRRQAEESGLDRRHPVELAPIVGVGDRRAAAGDDAADGRVGHAPAAERGDEAEQPVVRQAVDWASIAEVLAPKPEMPPLLARAGQPFAPLPPVPQEHHAERQRAGATEVAALGDQPAEDQFRFAKVFRAATVTSDKSSIGFVPANVVDAVVSTVEDKSSEPSDDFPFATTFGRHSIVSKYCRRWCSPKKGLRPGR